MEIADSARKHGVPDEDILHAIRNVIRTIDQGHDLTLFVGHDFAGRLLEVVIVDDDPAEEPVVIHAVALREKFRRQL